jgi:polyisoprenoid-binding protein YceI
MTVDSSWARWCARSRGEERDSLINTIRATAVRSTHDAAGLGDALLDRPRAGAAPVLAGAVRETALFPKEHAMRIFGRKNTTETATVPAAVPAAVNPDLAALTGDYTIDTSHTTIGFVARHAMVTNVKGKFLDFTGSLHLDGTDPSRSSASVDVKMDSIDTGSADRDGHLKSTDFFRTEEFPTMTFRSTEAEALGGDAYRITGELTILGVTKPLTIDLEFNGSAKDPFGNERVGFEGKAEILRSEWGLTWNAALETGGVLVSDRIKLNFDISAIKNP